MRFTAVDRALLAALVDSDAHACLVRAIRATRPEARRQRRRLH